MRESGLWHTLVYAGFVPCWRPCRHFRAMLRSALIVLTGLSVAANAWFLWRDSPKGVDSVVGSTPTPRVAQSESIAPPTAEATSVMAGQKAAGATENASSRRGLVWRPLQNKEDFKRLADDLRVAGFPARIIATALRELYTQHAMSQSPLADTPYWQRRGVEQSDEMRAHHRRTAAEVAELLGPDGRPSVLLDAVARRRQYGNIPDEKIDAITAIERDYQDLLMDVYRPNSGRIISTEDFNSQRQQTNLLDSEKRADLAAILSPAELAEYERHNADAAREITRLVSNISVTEAEFVALFEARKAFNTTNPPLVGTISAETMQQRSLAQLDYYDKARAALRDERFFSLLSTSDYNYRDIAALGRQHPSVTPAAAYEVLRLRAEMTGALNEARQGANAAVRIQEVYAQSNAKLEAMVGPEAAAALRKTTAGRQFNAPVFRPPPRPSG